MKLYKSDYSGDPLYKDKLNLWKGCRRLLLIIFLWLPLLNLFIIYNYYYFGIKPDYDEFQFPILHKHMDHGIKQCRNLLDLKRPITFPEPSLRSRNPRWSKERNVNGKSTILLKNAEVWNGDHKLESSTDILLSHGLISRIGKDLDISQLGIDSNDVEVIDIQGRIVTPGLVDQHSHMGVGSWPEDLFATQDVNEWVSPTTPQVRTIDAFNPHDPAIHHILSGGVTTSLVLPGSAELMGGEAYAVKLSSPLNNSAESMLLNWAMNSNGTDGPHIHWMKMACGENPKRTYSEMDMSPATRLGNAWIMREKFEQAKNLLERQEAWCEKMIKNHGHERESYHELGPYPEDLSLHSLVRLLQGNGHVRLNVHCYQSFDLETMIRISKEFGFQITTFHHALEAWKIPEILKENNISVATFSDHWAFKKEAWDANVKAGKILHEAGVKVAYKSDHPVLDANNLIFESQKAHHYGLEANAALKAVTSIPAERLGQGWRIGRIAQGYDADVVVWDRFPLDLSAHPLKIFVDGVQVYSIPFPPLKPKENENPIDSDMSHTQKIPISMIEKNEKLSNGNCNWENTLKKQQHQPLLHYAIINIGTAYLSPGQTRKNTTIVITNGVIDCIGSDCDILSDYKVFDLKGGTVIPGLIAAASKLGIVELASEIATQDGKASMTDPLNPIRAVDGLRMMGKELSSVFKAGVTSSISVPQFSTGNIFTGISVAVNTSAMIYNNAVIQSEVAYHVMIGNQIRGQGTSGSISGQIALLRKTLRHLALNKPKDDNLLKRVLKGEVPLAIHTHQADDIAKILALKEEIEQISKSTLRLIIVGGCESWMVANQLAKLQVSVLLRSRCVPALWETLRSRPYPSTVDYSSGLKILYETGVNVALYQSEDNFIRGLRWEAGWAFEDIALFNKGMNEEKAIGMVTWDIANMFNIPDVGIIKENFPAELIGFNGRPLHLDSFIQIVTSGTRVECYPQQP